MFEEVRLEKEKGFRIERKRIAANYAMKEAHFHPYYELFYMVSGSCNSFIDNALHSIHGGDLLLIRCMDIHRATHYSQGINERIVVNFTEQFLESFYAECGQEEVAALLQTSHVSVPEKRRPYLLQLFEEMKYEDSNHNSFSVFLKKKHLCEILINFFYDRENRNQKRPQNLFGDQAVMDAAEYISSHYMKELTLEEVAGIGHMSTTYFSRKFKQETGIGVKEYIIQIRVREASVLLLETGKTIREIASLCGFDDSNYFTEVFKRVKGVSPSQYRKNPEVV